MAGGVRGTGACVARGVRGRRPCMAWGEGGGVRGRRDGQCSGRYASYWNAFLLLFFLNINALIFKEIPDKGILTQQGHQPCPQPLPTMDTWYCNVQCEAANITSTFQ